MPQPGDRSVEPHREGQHQDNGPPENGSEGLVINGMESLVVDGGVFFNNLLVTSEALILGCDSIASVSVPMFNPFKTSFAKDSNGEILRDGFGNPLVPFITDNVQDVVTDVHEGVTKMFKIFESKDKRSVVAATTAGLAKLNGRPINSLARDFLDQRHTGKKLTSVEAIANEFLRFIRVEYEQDQKESELPEEYWRALEFLVGGFCDGDPFPSMYRIRVKDNVVKAEFKDGASGVAWAGQSASVERIIRGYDSDLKFHVEKQFDSMLDDHHHNMSQTMLRILSEFQARVGQPLPADIDTTLPKKPQMSLGWERFRLQVDYSNLPLQDAVDFVSFLALTETGSQKFNRGFATVGGRIHVTVLRKGHGCQFLNEPELKHTHTGFTG